jgi:hypothetical protein
MWLLYSRKGNGRGGLQLREIDQALDGSVRAELSVLARRSARVSPRRVCRARMSHKLAVDAGLSMGALREGASMAGKSCVVGWAWLECVIVESAVPLIYTRDSAPPAMGVAGRLVAMGVALACLSVLVVGMQLQPNGKEGIATHTQLGLQPCAFESRTGLPCPSCGFTTSVSYFAHGNVLASLYIQPMGFLIACGFAVGVWVGAYIAWTGRPVHRLMAMMPGKTLLIVLLTIAIGGWGWKIAIHLTGHDHWPV